VPSSEAEIALSFAPVVKAAAPAVVNIYARRVVESRRRSPFAGDPFFERFFRGLMPEGRRVQNALGSGVVVSSDGLVVSNHHVVGGAEEIRVVLADKREFDAELLLSDPDSDLAVLRLEDAEGLPALPLRTGPPPEVGDLVLAIGNPFGVGQTVTSGIVSALARQGTSPAGAAGYYIQTDAAINPGNSGGALVDMAGRLVGVNTAILSRSGGSNGVGFAIPAALVRQVTMQAAEGRHTLARPWVGLGGQPVDAAMAEALGLATPEGLIVSEIHPLSPFAEAGLQRGDVLLAIDGAPVSGPAELDFRLAALGLGAEVRVEWVRPERGRRDAVIRLGPAPEEPPRDPRRLDGPGPFAGLEVATLNPALAEQLGVPYHAEGAVVLDPGPTGARAGFREGDLIRAVNGRAVRGSAELEGLAGRLGRVGEVVVERDGRRGVLRFR